MKLKRSNFVNILIVPAICLIINSCKKDLPACSGNCITIQLSGKVYNLNTGAGLAGEPVSVYWYNRGFCLGCDIYKIAEGKTGNDGSFNFTTTIDTTYFRNQRIYVRTPVNTNYFFTPGSITDKYRQYFFDSISVNRMQLIWFGYYPKASLKIQLHRVQSDAFQYYTCSTSLPATFNTTSYNTIPGWQYAKDTTLTINTAADIYRYGIKKGNSVSSGEQKAENIRQRVLTGKEAGITRFKG